MSERFEQCVLRVAGDAGQVEALVARVTVLANVLGVVERSAELVDIGLERAEAERLRRQLSAAGSDVVLSWTEVAVDAPVMTGLERDQVLWLGDDLIVRPPWLSCPVGFDGVDLVVPRGSAFGSGEHDSTQAALILLHRRWRPSIADGTVADVGCGSGILARYAQLRGATRLTACDVEAASVRAATELLGISVRHGGPEDLDGADTIVANLDDRQLRAVLPALLDRWTGRGPLVLSGARADRADELSGRVPARRCAREPRGDFVAQWFELR